MKISLGAAQFGLDYGISNNTGKTKFTEVDSIIKYALNHNINYIDTAPAYGNSEKIIGELDKSNSFNVVTKTPVFDSLCITQKEVLLLKTTFKESLDRLSRNSVYALLLHNASDFFKSGGYKLFNEMARFKDSGLVDKIGVSVYSPQDIHRIIDNFPIDLIQLPLNIIDQRLIYGGELELLKQHDIEIHARSIFLQGLLLMPIENIDPYFNPIKDKLLKFIKIADEMNLSRIDLALGFVQSIDEIDHAIVGVESLDNLKQIASYKKIRTNTKIYNELFIDDVNFLNPSLWKVR